MTRRLFSAMEGSHHVVGERTCSKAELIKGNVLCPCKYSCVYTLSKYADKTLMKKLQVAHCDW